MRDIGRYNKDNREQNCCLPISRIFDALRDTCKRNQDKQQEGISSDNRYTQENISITGISDTRVGDIGRSKVHKWFKARFKRPQHTFEQYGPQWPELQRHKDKMSWQQWTQSMLQCTTGQRDHSQRKQEITSLEPQERGELATKSKQLQKCAETIEREAWQQFMETNPEKQDQKSNDANVSAIKKQIGELKRQINRMSNQDEDLKSAQRKVERTQHLIECMGKPLREFSEGQLDTHKWALYAQAVYLHQAVNLQQEAYLLLELTNQEQEKCLDQLDQLDKIHQQLQNELKRRLKTAVNWNSITNIQDMYTDQSTHIRSLLRKTNNISDELVSSQKSEANQLLDPEQKHSETANEPQQLKLEIQRGEPSAAPDVAYTKREVSEATLRELNEMEKDIIEGTHDNDLKLNMHGEVSSQELRAAPLAKKPHDESSNARSEGSISNEGQPDKKADWNESELPFLDLIRKSDEVAKASPKIAQEIAPDRLVNVIFTEEDANTFREKFRRIPFLNEMSHAFCMRARENDWSPDEIVRVDKQLSNVIHRYDQAVKDLTRAINKKLQTLLPPERLSKESFPKKHLEELEKCIKDNLEAILSNKEVSQKHRCHFIEAIGDLGDKDVMPCLIGMLDNQGIARYVRESIGEAIGRLGDKDVVLQKLGDERIDWALRRGIARGIGKSGNKDVAPDLVRMLGDQRIGSRVRESIGEAIGRLGDKDVVLNMLGDERMFLYVRHSIARGIGKSGNKDVAPDLVRMLGDQRIAVWLRHGIAEAIGDLGNKDVVPRLIEMRDDRGIDEFVRNSIGNAIGRLGDKEMVLNMLGDERINKAVRYDIAEGIGKSGNKDVVPRLIEMLSDTGISEYMHYRIGEAIGRLGDKEVILQKLGDERINGSVRFRIAKGIGKSGDKEVLPDLVKMLCNDRISKHVRCGIGEAIGELGDKEVVLKMLGDTGIDKEMRSRIIIGIDRSSDKDAVRNLFMMRNNREIDPNVINETIERFVDKA